MKIEIRKARKGDKKLLPIFRHKAGKQVLLIFLMKKYFHNVPI